MVTYNVSVEDRKIHLISQTDDGVGGNKGDIMLFTFDQEWQGEQIKAAFLFGGKYILRDIVGGQCEVPPIYNSVSFRLGTFVGDDEQSEPYLSSTTIEVPCKISIRDYLQGSEMNDEEFYLEALKVLNDIKDIANNAAEEARGEVTRLVGELGVVQNAGDSPTAVMSQKSTTSYLSKYDKRLTNIEKSLTPEPFDTDDSVAYIKYVPSNSLPYAKINKIGGMNYKEDGIILSTPVMGIESVGANFIPYPYVDTTKTVNGITFIDNGDGTITVNGTATATADFMLSNSLAVKAGTIISGAPNGTSETTFEIQAFLDSDNYIQTTNNMEVATKDFNAPAMIRIRSGYAANNLVFKPMLNKGTTALPYTPYVRNYLPIPEAVQALDGYGDGVNADCYNYIDWDKKQFVKRVERVDMGGLAWSTTSNGGLSASVRGLSQYISSPNAKSSLICEKYSVITPAQWYRRESVGICQSAKGYGAPYSVLVYDTKYTDADTFKAAMAGVMLYYELETPEVTNISDILPADNFIEVEGGGTITAVNEYGFAVPSDITYQIKGAKI